MRSINNKKTIALIESLQPGNIHAAFFHGLQEANPETVPVILPIDTGLSLDCASKYLKFFVDTYKPSFIISLGGRLPAWEIINGIPNSAIYCIDDPHSKKDGLFNSIIGRFRRYYTTNREIIPDYRTYGLKTEYLPFGFSPLYHCPRRVDKTYDVSFVGTPFIYRQDKLELLQRESTRRKFNFYHRGGLNRVSYLEAARIINATKININFSDQPDGYIGAKNRVPEIMGSGGFLLTQWFPEIEDYATPGKECETFKTKEEMMEKIVFYLSHYQEKRKIAEAGYQRAVSCHTYAIRAHKIFGGVF